MKLIAMRWLRFWRLSLVAVLVVASFAADSSFSASSVGLSRPKTQQPAPIGAHAGEMRLSPPKHYAVVQDRRHDRKALYTAGDVIVHPKNPAQSLTFEQVDLSGMRVRDNASRGRRIIRPGEALPGFPELILDRTVLLEVLQYRFKAVARIVAEEPRVLSIAGATAVLEKQVLRLPDHLAGGSPSEIPAAPRSGKKNHADSLTASIREVDKNLYEVPEAVVRPIIETAGKMLSQIRPRFTPTYASGATPPVDWTSVMGDVSLTDQGFTVTRAGVAQRFGIEVGDRVVRLNGRPVTSPLSAWWTYQEVFIKDRRTSNLRVDVLRDGRVIRKTVRIR